MCGELHLNIKNLLNLTTAGHLAWEAILVPANHERKYPEKNKFPQVLLVGRTWCWWSCLRPACPRRRHLSPRSPASRSPSRPRTHSSRFHLQGPPAQVILHSFPPLTVGGMEKKRFHLEGESSEIRCYKHRLHVYGQIHQPSWTIDLSRCVSKNTHFLNGLVFQRRNF